MTAPARHRLPSLIWLQGLLCGALVALAPSLAMLLASFLGPAIAAALFDRDPGKPRARAAFLFSAASGIAPVHTLWSGSGDMSAALSLALNPTTLVRTWVAGGAGWALAEVAPIILQALMTFTDRLRRSRLEALREQLKEEWGSSG